MTLSDVVVGGVQAEWYEAVALVREVIDRCTAVQPHVAPDLTQVSIRPNGDVVLHGGAAVADPAPAVVQMLQELLGSSKPPPQLAMLAAKPPESVQALSDALAYFERPNRPLVLREFYNRASTQVPPGDPDELIASLRATTAAAPAEERQEEQKSTGGRRALYVIGGLAAGIVLIVVGALAWQGDAAADGENPTVTDKMSRGLAGVATAVGQAVSSVRERVGLGSGTAQPAAPVETATPSARGTGSGTSARAKKPPVPAPQVTPVTDFALVPIPQDRVFQWQPLEVPQATIAERVVRATDPDQVFSPGSSGVTAPVTVRPYFPKLAPADARADDAARIDLVISPAGSVESAKLVGQPRSVHDFMLVSAVKAWRFHPAMKDGSPVRYQMSILVVR